MFWEVGGGAPINWFNLQMLTVTGAEPGWLRKPAAKSRFPTDLSIRTISCCFCRCVLAEVWNQEWSWDVSPDTQLWVPLGQITVPPPKGFISVLLSLVFKAFLCQWLSNSLGREKLTSTISPFNSWSNSKKEILESSTLKSRLYERCGQGCIVNSFIPVTGGSSDVKEEVGLDVSTITGDNLRDSGSRCLGQTAPSLLHFARWPSLLCSLPHSHTVLCCTQDSSFYQLTIALSDLPYPCFPESDWEDDVLRSSLPTVRCESTKGNWPLLSYGIRPKDRVFICSWYKRTQGRLCGKVGKVIPEDAYILYECQVWAELSSSTSALPLVNAS